MNDEEIIKVCPECGFDLVKEPYEDYYYCPDCGWDEEMGSLDPDTDDVLASEDEVILDIEDEETDTNFDPEAGEDA